MSDTTSQITELLATLRGAYTKARALAETHGTIDLLLATQNIGSAVEELENALESQGDA